MIVTGAASLITKERVPEVLPYALPWIEKTLEEMAYTRWTLEGIVEQLQKGELQLWASYSNGKHLFVLTEMIRELTGLTVHIVLGAGRFDKNMLKHLDIIETWAKGQGATGFVIWGRWGWEKLLRPLGFKFETAVFRRTFTERLN